MPEEAKPTQILSLTGLRFVAAASIAFAHLSLNVNPQIFDVTVPLSLSAILGMPLFFTLSGFVIHYVYSASFLTPSATTYARFAASRISRIFPLFLFFFAFNAMVTSLGVALIKKENLAVLISYVTGTFSWVPFVFDGIAPIQFPFGVAWSVSTELFFYVLYAVGLYRINQITSVRRCAYYLIAFSILSYGYFAALFFTRDIWEPLALSSGVAMPSRQEDFLNSFYRWFLYVSPYSRIFEFIGGCLTCQLYLNCKREGVVFNGSWVTYAGVIGVTGFFLLYGHFAVTGTAWLSDHSLPSLFMALHLNFLLAGPCYLLIFGLTVEISSLNRVLSAKIPVHLGDISYSIYLGHPAALMMVYIAVTTSFKGPKLLLGSLMIVILATGLYRVIELPFKEWLRQLSSRAIQRFAVPSRPVPHVRQDKKQLACKVISRATVAGLVPKIGLREGGAIWFNEVQRRTEL